MITAVSFLSIWHLNSASHNQGRVKIKSSGEMVYNFSSIVSAEETISTYLRASEDAIADKFLTVIDSSSKFLHHNIETIGHKFPTLRGDRTTNKLVPSYHRHEQQISNRDRKRIAYAITITKDGMFLDGAAVLVYSIMKHSSNSKYDISFIAFVHPNVTTSRPGLKRLGFHVIEVPTPVNTSAIKFEFLRDHIDKNGCCGATELIKLTSYRLSQYHRIIHLDADTMLLNVSKSTMRL
jgi:hypothetical protein